MNNQPLKRCLATLSFISTLFMLCSISTASDYKFTDFQKKTYERAVGYFNNEKWIYALEEFSTLYGSIRNDFKSMKNAPKGLKRVTYKIHQGIRYCRNELKYAVRRTEVMDKYGDEFEVIYSSSGKMDGLSEKKREGVKLPFKVDKEMPRLQERLN